MLRIHPECNNSRSCYEKHDQVGKATRQLHPTIPFSHFCSYQVQLVTEYLLFLPLLRSLSELLDAHHKASDGCGIVGTEKFLVGVKERCKVQLPNCLTSLMKTHFLVTISRTTLKFGLRALILTLLCRLQLTLSSGSITFPILLEDNSWQLEGSKEGTIASL